MKSKLECQEALNRAKKYGNLNNAQLAKLTRAEQDEFASELSIYMSGGSSDEDRDSAQNERLQRLAADLAATL